MRSILAGVTALVGGALLMAGCSSSSSSSAAAGGTSAAARPARCGGAPVTVRLGYLANITHAPALIAVKNGYFTKDLGSAGSLKTTVFTSGTQETTAILAGQLDAAYVGPNPAINALQKSGGNAIKIISGAATGGAPSSSKPTITSAAQLKGQSLATPSLGNTQDVAVRYWLKQQGLTTSATGGGDVAIKPTTPNSAAVLEFKSGQIAGASEPSPYDVEMVQDGGKVLLTEPGVTTVLVVTQSFLAAHPAVVADLLKANLAGAQLHQVRPVRRRAGRQRRARRLHRQAAEGDGARPRRSRRSPSPTTRTRRRSPRTRSRPPRSGCSSNGQPERDLRPGPAQLGPHRRRPADGQRRLVAAGVPGPPAAGRRAAAPAGNNSEQARVTEPPCPRQR